MVREYPEHFEGDPKSTESEPRELPRNIPKIFIGFGTILLKYTRTTNTSPLSR
jgi:hypothetical protein